MKNVVFSRQSVLVYFEKFSILLAILTFWNRAQSALAQIQALNSLPSSSFVLLIDMDGHTDTSGWWNDGNDVVAAAPGYNSSQATEVFNRVAEDFRPFDINVTTQQSVYLDAPVANRQRVVITPTDGWYNTGGNNAGGVAYLGTFGGGEIACWVFSNNLGSVANAAEAASHELGHTLGLNHQSRYNSDCTKNTEYHSGQGSGQTSWAPIMGVGYGRTISQWYHGPGNGSTCSINTQNDLDRITNPFQNGFSYRTDDVGNSISDFTNIAFSGNSVSRTGIISTTQDVDVFRVQLPNSGIFRFSSVPYAHNPSSLSGANLDLKMSIRNENNIEIASFDPTDVLTASGILSLEAGNYFIIIDGAGIPNYVPSGGKGPNDYGSLGQYTLTISTETCTAALQAANSGERCGNGSLTLSVNPNQGSSVSWYSTGGNLLGTQNSYTTPSLSTSTTYYVEVFNANCTSAIRTPVNANISISPTLSAIGGPSQVQVGNTILLSQSSTLGQWSSSNNSLATVSQTGLVNGLAPGQADINYSATIGSCPTVSVSKSISINSVGPCPGAATVSDVDGNVYNTVLIGNQCWTVENLKTTRFADNSIIQNVPLPADWANLSAGAWCHFGNDQTYENPYGKLYNGYSVFNSKGLCPAGWHVPDLSEFNLAGNFLNGSNVAGGKMKTSILWASPNTGATNSSGFSGLPAGGRNVDGSFANQTTRAHFWTISNSEGGQTQFELNHDSPILSNFNGNQKAGYSIRCVKDDATGFVPSIQYIYAGTTCGPGQVSVYASPSKGFVNWYTSPSGGTPFFTGTYFQSPVLNTSVTYYVEAVYGVNVSSPRTAVTARVKPVFSPGALAAGNETFCGPGNPGLISMAQSPVSGDSIAYQWYYQDGIQNCPSASSTTGWVLISGANASTFDPPNLTLSRTYALMVTPLSKRSEGGGTGQPVGGGQVCGQATWATGCRQITIQSLPSVSISAGGPTSFCQGGSVTLTAQGAQTYSWAPGNQTSNSITISQPGVYEVTGTSSEGCFAKAAVSVTVNPVPQVNAGPDQVLTLNNGNISLNGTPSGGIWAGQGTSQSGIFSTQQPSGFYNVSYCFTNAENCSKCDTLVIQLLNPPAQVALPVINPPTGTYAGPQMISITCATPGSQIYYTTSGNIPVVGTSFTRLYTGSFQVLQNTTIRAIGVLNGATNSAVAASFITLSNPSVVANPVISPNGGTFANSITVSLSTNPSDAQIYYTTNGNLPLLNPFPNSFTRIYTGPFTLSSSSTIRAIGVKNGLTNSGISVANFTITSLGNVQPVVFSPSPGVYSGPQNISMSTATPSATIYYTTNGNVPLLNPFPNSFTRIYSSPVPIQSSATIRAIATRTGFTNSPTAVGIFTISPVRKVVSDENKIYYFFENAEEEKLVAEGVEIFPNPFSNSLRIRWNEEWNAETAEVRLFDLHGKCLIHQKVIPQNGENEIETQSLPQGLYQFLIQVENRIIVKKLIK
jgi:uncharacterized protein (TIGR02145 family)